MNTISIYNSILSSNTVVGHGNIVIVFIINQGYEEHLYRSFLVEI